MPRHVDAGMAFPVRHDPATGRFLPKEDQGGEARDKAEPVHTADVDEALALLRDGQAVELDQPREISTLIDKLAAIGDDAMAKGKAAPNYNLCGVSVEGTNLFCAGNQGVDRLNMPQLVGAPAPGTPADSLPRDSRGQVDLTGQYMEHLQTQGVSVVDEQENPAYLRATQNELNGVKVAQIARAMEQGMVIEGAIWVSKDNYILDGHHRWAAQVALQYAEAGRVQPIAVHRADIGITTLLPDAEAFVEAEGLPASGIGQNMPVHATVAAAGTPASQMPVVEEGLVQAPVYNAVEKAALALYARLRSELKAKLEGHPIRPEHHAHTQVEPSRASQLTVDRFEVRHDPATGRFLPKGDAGGQKAEVVFGKPDMDLRRRFADDSSFEAFQADARAAAVRVQALFPDRALSFHITDAEAMPGIYALTHPPHDTPYGDEPAAVIVSQTYFGSAIGRGDLETSLAENVANGFHPELTGSAEAVLAHEFGHVVTYDIAFARPVPTQDELGKPGASSRFGRPLEVAMAAVAAGDKATQDPRWVAKFSRYAAASPPLGYSDPLEVVAEAVSHVAMGGRNRGALAIVESLGGRAPEAVVASATFANEIVNPDLFNDIDFVDVTAADFSDALTDVILDASTGARIAVGFTLPEQVVQGIVDGHLRVVGTMGTRLRQAVARWVGDSMAEGLSIDDMVGRLPEDSPLSELAALTTARTETVAAANAGAFGSWRAGDVGGFKQWASAGDARVRPDHVEANGQIVGLDETFIVCGGQEALYPGDPNLDAGCRINCFAPDTPVGHAAVVGTYRRRYDGPMVKLATASGELAGTPNHPVLTSRGWVPLHAVAPGDYLVRGPLEQYRSRHGDPDVQDMPATLEQVEVALLQASVVHREPVAAMDFHGDGAKGDVDVVRAVRELRLRGFTERLKPFDDLPFALAYMSLVAPSLSSAGPRGPRDVGVALAASGRVSGGSEAGALFGLSVRHADGHRRSATPDHDAGLNETPSDHRARHAEPVRSCQLGLPADVSLDEVLDVEVVSYHGDVLNVETTTGWYTAGPGFVVGNCRCTLLYSDNDGNQVDLPTNRNDLEALAAERGIDDINSLSNADLRDTLLANPPDEATFRISNLEIAKLSHDHNFEVRHDPATGRFLPKDDAGGQKVTKQPTHGSEAPHEVGVYAGPGSAYASPSEHASAVRAARRAMRNAPKPTDAETAKGLRTAQDWREAQAKYLRGEGPKPPRAGGERSGSNVQRAKRSQEVFDKFREPGKDYCCCAGCGKKLKATVNSPGPYEALTKEKLVPGKAGGDYRLANLIPLCRRDNQSINQRRVPRFGQPKWGDPMKRARRVAKAEGIEFVADVPSWAYARERWTASTLRSSSGPRTRSDSMTATGPGPRSSAGTRTPSSSASSSPRTRWSKGSTSRTGSRARSAGTSSSTGSRSTRRRWSRSKQLELEVRHDPATGRFLPKGDAGGQKASGDWLDFGPGYPFSDAYSFEDNDARVAFENDAAAAADAVHAVFPAEAPFPIGGLSDTKLHGGRVYAFTTAGDYGDDEGAVFVPPHWWASDVGRAELLASLTGVRGDWLAPRVNTPEGVLAHEFGHVIQRRRWDGDRAEMAAQAVEKAREATVKEPGMLWPREFSRYAMTDPQEAVSEAVAHVAMGGHDLGARTIVKYLVDHDGREAPLPLPGAEMALTFEVRHDPATGRFLPKGDPGGPARVPTGAQGVDLRGVIEQDPPAELLAAFTADAYTASDHMQALFPGRPFKIGGLDSRLISEQSAFAVTDMASETIIVDPALVDQRDAVDESLQRDAQNGWAPASISTIPGVMAHEMGHVIEARFAKDHFPGGDPPRFALNKLALRQSREAIDAGAKATGDPTWMESYSRYGAKDALEGVAMALADVAFGNRQPGPVAVAKYYGGHVPDVTVATIELEVRHDPATGRFLPKGDAGGEKAGSVSVEFNRDRFDPDEAARFVESADGAAARIGALFPGAPFRIVRASAGLDYTGQLAQTHMDNEEIDVSPSLVTFRAEIEAGLAKDAASGFMSPHDTTVDSVLAHEMGHVVNSRVARARGETPLEAATAAIDAGAKATGDPKWMDSFSSYGAGDPLEGVATAIAEVAMGGRHPGAVAVVEQLGGSVRELGQQALGRLDFEVRHDPATGRFLPKDDPGGQKAEPGPGLSSVLFPSITGNAYVDTSPSDRREAADAIARLDHLFPGAGVQVQVVTAGQMESVYQGAAAWTMAGAQAVELGLADHPTVVLGTANFHRPASVGESAALYESHLKESERAYTLDHEMGHVVMITAFERAGVDMTSRDSIDAAGVQFQRRAFDAAGLPHYGAEGTVFSSYGRLDGLENIAEAVAIEQAGAGTPFSRAIVDQLNRELGPTQALTTFEVRHDPATGRFLPKGDAGGSAREPAKASVAFGDRFRSDFPHRSERNAITAAARSAADRVQGLFPGTPLRIVIEGAHRQGLRERLGQVDKSYAAAWPERGDPAPITLNPDWATKAGRQDLTDKLTADREMGWNPEMTNSAEGMLAHEIGHIVEYQAAGAAGHGYDVPVGASLRDIVRSQATAAVRLADEAEARAQPGRESWEHWPLGFSGYGVDHPTEAVAEAIAHVAMGGQDAGALAVVDFYRERLQGPPTGTS